MALRLAEEPWKRAARELRRAWPAVMSGSVDAVHAARVATRRLREAVPVFDPSERGARRLEKDFRTVTRVLGPMRELDVTMGLVVRLLHDEPAHEGALEAVRLYLLEQRALLRNALRRKVDDVDVAGLVARVKALAASEPGASRRPSVIARDEIRRRIVERSARVRQAVESAGALYAPEPLHEVRIAIKKLRYGVELGRTARLAGAARYATRLKKLQDLLGDWHDWQVLGNHAGRVQASLPMSDPRLSDLTALVTVVEDRCRALHATFLAARTDLLPLVDEIALRMGLAAPRNR